MSAELLVAVQEAVDGVIDEYGNNYIWLSEAISASVVEAIKGLVGSTQEKLLTDLQRERDRRYALERQNLALRESVRELSLRVEEIEDE